MDSQDVNIPEQHQVERLTTLSELTTENESAQPFRVVLLGFKDKTEQARVNAMFANADRWQQPWQVVAELRLAEFLLIAADSPADLIRWRNTDKRFNHDRLIAYSAQPLTEARWYLQRPESRKAPSPLEFTLLLKEISQEFEALRLDAQEQAAVMSSKKQAQDKKDWLELAKDALSPISKLISKNKRLKD